MISILTHLEPFREGKKAILINEFDEFNTIQFVLKGKLLIGFELNKVNRYCLQFNDKCIIGAFGATFNQRAAFIYKSMSPIEGFFIRKEAWQNALEENDSIGRSMKQNIWLDYMTRIKMKVNLAKKRLR